MAILILLFHQWYRREKVLRMRNINYDRGEIFIWYRLKILMVLFTGYELKQVHFKVPLTELTVFSRSLYLTHKQSRQKAARARELPKPDIYYVPHWKRERERVVLICKYWADKFSPPLSSFLAPELSRRFTLMLLGSKGLELRQPPIFFSPLIHARYY